MNWSRILAWMLALSTLAIAPLTPAQRPVAISLSGIESGVEQGDEANRVAEARALRLDELTVNARIAGPLADIEIDMLIASNGQDGRQDEARLAIDLPQDAVVTGYALDVDGQLIPGQLLEAAKARNVYEDEVRKGIDPGLAEVSARNRFSTRVYPVSPGHPRRVRLRFSAPFDAAKGLTLPLDTLLPVGIAKLDVRADGYSTAPQLNFAGQALQMQRAGLGWQAATALQSSRLEGGLSLRGDRQLDQMLVTRHANGRRFFTISGQATNTAPIRTGGRLRIYWDRSRSHLGAGEADEIAALVAMAEQMRPQAIDLVSFASDNPQVSSVATPTALRAALEQVSYRGATSLAGLDSLKLLEAQTCVLVSDGQLTIDRMAEFRPDCRLSALSADPGANGARLARIAQRQGGQFVRVMPGKGAEAGAALGQSGVSVVAVTSETSGRIAWRSFSWGNGGWLVIGQLPFDTRTPSPGDIKVRVAGYGGHVTEQAYAPDSSPIGIDAAGALWAGDRAAELGDNPEQHDRMLSLARSFQVAGNGLSFLVLEDPEQYLKADIAPPPGFPKDWFDRYRDAKAEQIRDKDQLHKERLAEVVANWQTRRTWWNTPFPGKTGGQGNQDEPGDTRALRAPPPPPPPPPPSPAQADATAAVPPERRPEPRQASNGRGNADDESSQEIIVTSQRRTSSAQDTPTAVTTLDGHQLTAKMELKLETVLADRPYLKSLDAAAETDRMAVLARQEAEFGAVPAFYFDVAEWFRLKGEKALARELLLSSLELASATDETLQIVAFRLERDGEYDLAVQLAEQFSAGARFRPQPKRVLALALAARGSTGGRDGRADLERAFTLLTEVALSPDRFEDDFDGLEVIALMEANALIPRIEALGGTWRLDRRLVGLFDSDARIVIEWTADDADIDLWVDEPGGERVMYSHNLSRAGGTISNDMTDGYGPEEYIIRRAPKGSYTVRVNGFDADRINPNGPGHVLVRLTRNFGRRDQQLNLLDVDLGFQKGGNRNAEDGAVRIAELTVN